MNYKNISRVSLLALSAALAQGLFSPAQAQVPAAQTGSASAGRVEQQQIQQPDNAAKIAPRLEVKEAKNQQAPAGSEKISFVLKDISISGVSVYTQQQLSSVYADKIGQTITLADLYGIAGDLTKKYRNDGYILTQIVVPPQTIESGTAKLQVVEGYVDSVNVQGADKGMGLIQKYASKIKTNGGATNVKDLERWMLLVNDLPGVTARGVLSPSATKTGAADMTVIVERKPFEGFASLDNYGSRYLGPTQLTGSATANSLFGLNERITAQIVTTPWNGLNPEMSYVGLNYVQPIFDYGTTFEVFGSKSKTQPGFDLKQFDVDGQSDLLGVTLRQPFLRSRELNFTGRATVDYRNVTSNNDIEAERHDHIRALRLGGRFEAIDTFFGVGYNTADVEVSHGLDMLNASETSDTNVSRPDADPDFYKMNVELQRLQRLTSSFNLLVAATGQKANNPLYSSEEFGVGGISYGRGYDPSEITGDDGVAGKVELQWNSPYKISYLESSQLFGFYDAGKVWNQDATSSAGKSDSLASTGFGFRAELPMKINAGALLAFPLTRDPQTEADKARLLFTLSKKF